MISSLLTPHLSMLSQLPRHQRYRLASWLLLLSATGMAFATEATTTPAAGITNTAKAPNQSAAMQSSYTERPEAHALAHEIANKHGWELAWVQRWLTQAQRLPSVIKLVTPSSSPSAKNWITYRARFLEPSRIEAGIRFWQKNRITLEQAEERYGVPAWLVVGIIGVETLYGRNTGSFRVLDALATLSFDFPSSHPKATERQTYFRGELETLLQLSREQGISPDAWRGSYAGAMGLPQFMPSSWMKYAVDFDGDGKIDLQNSPADAIGSVAHYMQAYGWQKGLATHYAVKVEANDKALATLLAPDIKPTFERTSFEALGAQLDRNAKHHNGLLALIELRNGDPTQGGQTPSFIAGTDNFYVVTRYNWSAYYAMAVIELGQTVQAALPK